MPRLRPLPDRDTGTGQFQYHYSRKERLSQASGLLKGSLQPDGRSWFSRNRGSLLILGNILLIILIASVFLPLADSANEVTLGGLRFRGGWFELEDELFIRIRATIRGDETSAAGEILFIWEDVLTDFVWTESFFVDAFEEEQLQWTLRFSPPSADRAELSLLVQWAGDEVLLPLEKD